MKVARETAVTLLSELGYKTAKNLSDSRLLGKLQGLPEKLDDEAVEQVESKDALKLVRAMIKDSSIVEDIEIVGEAETNGKAKASKGKAAKAAKKGKAAETDEDEDEEEDAADEEGDEDEEEEGDEEDTEDEDKEGDDEDEEGDDEDEEEEEEAKAKSKKGKAAKGKDKKAAKGKKGKASGSIELPSKVSLHVAYSKASGDGHNVREFEEQAKANAFYRRIQTKGRKAWFVNAKGKAL